MSFNIALHTTQVPTLISPHQEIIAIIDLTQERAIELLELMDDVTLKACLSSTTYKICTFEASALYVPAYALSQLPSVDDFIVLPSDYSVTAVIPIKLVHTNVLPLYVNWTATHEDNHFMINSAELDAEILKLAARGEVLQPGATSYSVKHAQRPSSRSIITPERDWLQ